MIDTLKIGIPLSQHQYKKIYKKLIADENWQWVQFQGSSGEIKYRRLKGLAKLQDQPSFHREIFWDIPDDYRQDETFLIFEFSVPKFWYGHNIHLLYDFTKALRVFKKILENQINCRFVDVLEWKLYRVDICYAWRCPSQFIAQQVLDSLKHLHYPRKKPHIYETTIMFTGTSYSLKFYLKLPEFLHHDRKILLKNKASLEWITDLEQRADGVLRCETTLRRDYLNKNNITTVNDLIEPFVYLVFEDEKISIYYQSLNKIQRMTLELDLVRRISKNLTILLDKKEELEISELERLRKNKYLVPSFQFNDGILFPGGECFIKSSNKLTSILNEFLDKFIGEYKGMDDAEQIKIKLLENYKPSRATKLIGFWLAIQRYGSKEVKAMFGDRSYYRCKQDLKSAGISLLEPTTVIDASDKFRKEFKIEIPSSWVTNKVDDFRESDNIFNLPNKALLTKSQEDIRQEKLKAQEAKKERIKQKQQADLEKLKKLKEM